MPFDKKDFGYGSCSKILVVDRCPKYHVKDINKKLPLLDFFFCLVMFQCILSHYRTYFFKRERTLLYHYNHNA